MATIVTRAGKGAPLTHAEVDANFTNLNSDKVETSAIGTAAAADTGDFATAAQGTLADSAIQAGDLATVATTGAYSDLSGLPTLGTAAATASTDYATAAQGTLADSAVQPDDDVSLGDVQFGGALEETVYALSGTTPALDPANGTIQTHTLSGNTTYSDSLTAGEQITLMIDDGASRTVTWPTITWVNNGGSAPTLATTGYTVVAIWKVSTTLYGALVGDGS